MSNHHDLIAEAVKASPPVTVAGLSLNGVSMQDWVYVLTGVYVFMQIVLLVYDRIIRKGHNDHSKH